MQPDPITVPATMPFLDVQHLFVVAHIGSAPIVDVRGCVLGMITNSDLLRTVDQFCDDEVDPGSSMTPGALSEQLAELVAGDVGTQEVVWVPLDAPISVVAHLMRTEGIHRVLVGQNGQLAGILTTFDLLRAVT
jgi:CBS domain-containing protein